MSNNKAQAIKPDRRKGPRRDPLLWEELLALPPDAQARVLAAKGR